MYNYSNNIYIYFSLFHQTSHTDSLTELTVCFLVYSDTKVTQNGAGLNLQGGVNVVQLQVRCDGQQGECVRRALQKHNARANQSSKLSIY